LQRTAGRDVTRRLRSVSAGKLADLVAVPSNPLDDISVMKRVSFVMKAGTVYRRNGNAVDQDAPAAGNSP
jgi:imidazolonepropionase-like amidohydrolase